MSESEPVQRDIAAIRTRMDQIESMQRLIVASSKDVKEHIYSVLSNRENAAEIIILLADGPLLQDVISVRLKKSAGPVSQALSYLHDHGLLVHYKDPDNQRKNRWILNPLENTVNAIRIAKEIVSERKKTQNRRSSNRSSKIPPS